MTSSGSSSTSRRAMVLCGAAAALLACASTPTRGDLRALADRSTRIAVLPTESLVGSAAPLRRFRGSVEAALRARGLDVVAGEELQAFLARHRVRYTGGIDAPTARAIRAEMGAEAVVVASVDLYATLGVPRFAMTVRLVSTDEEPTILWMDGWARAGDDAPGLFGIGLEHDVAALEEEALADLTGGLVAFLESGRAPERCPSERRLRPRLRFRQSLRPTEGLPRLAVLPLHNESARRDAGEIVALQLVKHLVATGLFQVLEPGVVRSELLRNRIVMEGGVTHEAARMALATQRVDVVVGGTVYAYARRVEFTVTGIETWENRVVWESRSSGAQDPKLVLFGLGRLSTSEDVACRMARAVADGMAAVWKTTRRSVEPVRGRGAVGSLPGRRRFDVSAESATVASGESPGTLAAR